ncbi:MAG: hypothetical protein U0798_11440 [Gemmataceae bacterium]
MRTYLLVSVLLLLPISNGAIAADKPALPTEWHGVWTGELVIHGAGEKVTKVPLTLTIKPMDAGGLSWKAEYGGNRPVIKDYKLLPGDKAGRFKIDEGGGLVLDARLDGGVLLSSFAVGETVLTARYELSGKVLRFEVTSSRKTNDKLPGGVQGYEITAVQRAELARSK